MSENKKDINYILNCYVKEFGAKDAYKNLDNLIKSAKEMQKQFEGMPRWLDQSKKGFIGLSNSISSTFSVLAKLGVSATSLKSVLDVNYKLNLSLRSVGSEFLKYGIGFSQLNNRIEKFAVTNRMLRTEVLSLASAIQTGFRNSAGNFENIIKMFEKVVGNNPQAIQQQISSISALSEEYIGLGKAITSVGSGGNLSDYQKKIITLYADIGDSVGILNKQQSDQLQDILASQMDGIKGITEEDKKRKQQIDEEIAAMRTFEQTQERIAVTLAQEVMPAVKTIAEIFQQWNKEIVSLVKWVGILTAGFYGIKNITVLLPNLAKIGAYGAGKISGMAKGLDAVESVAEGASVAKGASGVAKVAGEAGAIGSRALPYLAAAYVGNELGNSMEQSSAFDLARNFSENYYDSIAGAFHGRFNFSSGQNSDKGSVEERNDMIRNNEYMYEKQDESFRKREAKAKSMEEISLITAEKGYAELQRSLDQERTGKLSGTVNNLRRFGSNLVSGDPLAWKTDNELELEKKMEKQMKIIHEKKSEFKKVDALYKEKENIQRSEEIYQLEAIAKLEKASTPERQKQRLEMDLMRQNLKSQRELLQSNLNLLTSISEKTKSVGGINTTDLFSQMGKYSSNMDETFKRNILNQKMARLKINNLPEEEEKIRALAALQLRSSEAELRKLTPEFEKINNEINITPESEKKSDSYLEKLQKAADLRSKIDSANLQKSDAENPQEQIFKIRSEAKAALMDYEAEFQKLISSGSDLANIYANTKSKLIEMKTASAGVVQQQISLVDNLAMGVGASAEMRMQASDALSKSLDAMKQQLKDIDIGYSNFAKRKKELEEEYSKATTEEDRKKIQGEIETQEAALIQSAINRSNAESKILGTMQQQADLLRTLRDGYISAIDAMNTGAGVFSKIIFDKNKNLGILMQQGLSPTAIRTGSSAGGFLSSERFTPTGISSSSERRMFPIVKPEWGLDTGFSGINGRGSLQDIAKSVSEQIPSKVSQMSADMSAISGNVSNLSRLLGASPSVDSSNLKSAKNSPVPNVIETSLEHINRIRGNRGLNTGSSSDTSSSLFSSGDKKDIAKMISKEIGSLIKDAVVAAKEDIMSEIHKGLG